MCVCGGVVVRCEHWCSGSAFNRRVFTLLHCMVSGMSVGKAPLILTHHSGNMKCCRMCLVDELWTDCGKWRQWPLLRNVCLSAVAAKRSGYLCSPTWGNCQLDPSFLFPVRVCFDVNATELSNCCCANTWSSLSLFLQTACHSLQIFVILHAVVGDMATSSSFSLLPTFSVMNWFLFACKPTCNSSFKFPSFCTQISHLTFALRACAFHCVFHLEFLPLFLLPNSELPESNFVMGLVFS